MTSKQRELLARNAQTRMVGYSINDDLCHAIAAALADLDARRSLLEELEWSDSGFRKGAVWLTRCPVCGAWKVDNHTPDCRLGAVLAAAGEEQT